MPGEKPDSALTEAALTHATVYPQGAKLPDSFRQSQWPDVDYWSAGCLKNGLPCDIIILPLGDADAPLLMVVSATLPGAGLNGLVMGQNAYGKWQKVGSVDLLECSGVLNACVTVPWFLFDRCTTI